jgi:light-harvesting complex I chlorophyll a/b binding protein 1
MAERAQAADIAQSGAGIDSEDLAPVVQTTAGPQGFGAGAMAAYSALVSVVVGISFAAGRYFGAPQQRAQVPSYGSSMHMAAMMDDDDDENDLMGLLGLAETAGLRGGIAPLGDYWDPAGLSEGKDFLEVKMWREAELKHGRLAMLAVVGLPFAEFWHPLAPDYDGNALGMITQPQILGILLALPVAYLAEKASLEMGRDADGKMKDSYEPGDLNWDPLGLKPGNNATLEDTRIKEISNGRLAMIGFAGMVAQELVTGAKLF